MGTTHFGTNDPNTVKKWADSVAVTTNKDSYFLRSMVGTHKKRLPGQLVTELEKDKGDEITVSLLMPSNQRPVVGEESLAGKAQRLRYSTDRLRIDLVRSAADPGGTMTRKRVTYNLRDDAKTIQSDWWKRAIDEAIFIYLTGAVGVNKGQLWTADSAFFQVNQLTAPDAQHLMYGGAATSKASLAAGDTYSLRLIDKFLAKANTMGGDGTDEISMVPVDVGGTPHYVALMHEWQWDQLKLSTATNSWVELQKAAAGAEGQKSPIFIGSQGKYSGVVLHKHRNVQLFNDYGAGGNVGAARSLFLGAQGFLLAFGSSNGTGLTRFKWTEQVDDHEEKMEIGTSAVLGVKKSTYRNAEGVTRDFGVIAADTACVDPNA